MSAVVVLAERDGDFDIDAIVFGQAHGSRAN